MRTRLIRLFQKLLLERHLRFTFSQFAEDIVILSLFDRRYKGIYIDIGAHHPRRYSNTYLLYLRGWRGVNVDPSPRAVRLLNRERRRDFNIQAAVTSEPGTVTMYEFRDHAFNTLSSGQAERVRRPYNATMVEAITVSEVFSRGGIDPGSVDLLNVDVEGKDLEVLQQFDFNVFRPRCICIEIHGFEPANLADSPSAAFMQAKGYRLHSYVHVSAIFVSVE